MEASILRRGLPRKGREPTNVTATERVRVAVEEEILSGTLEPGARLDEIGLSARFGVSRTPVREALKQLSAAGLIHIRPHHGATVVKPTLAEVLERFEVMLLLESSCARLAARRHTLEDQARMRAALAECMDAETRGDGISYYEANNRFHESIYRATSNSFLARQTLALRNRLMPFRRFVTFHPGRMSLSNGQHRAIQEAIFAMEPERAADIMSEHLATLRDDVAGLFSST